MIRPTHILCHYAEIGLKGQNRSYFERILKDNLKISVKRICEKPFRSIKILQGRIIIELAENGQNCLPEIVDAFHSVYGLAFFCPAERCKADFESVNSKALSITSDIDYNTFRVTARKSYSSIPVSTQKVNEDLGEAIQQRDKKPVSLKNPELNVHIDFLTSGAYIFTEKIPGPGGLPHGSSGRAIVMLSGGLDSPVAAWYAQRRGLHPFYVHFHSVPYTSEASIEKVKQLSKILDRFQRPTKIALVPFANIQEAILQNADPKYRVILYRRFMLRIAEIFANNENCHGIFTGESLGQVASQTMENMQAVQEAVSLPIHRPLIGMDKQDIIAKAKEIGTYETSILAHEDCCTLFVPKHPVTKARISDVIEQESALDVDRLVREAVEQTEIEYTLPKPEKILSAK